MKSIFRLAAVAAFLFASTASADLILVTPDVPDGGSSSPASEEDIVTGVIGETVVFDFRCESDGLVECLEGIGVVSNGSYSVSPFSGDPAMSDVSWDLTGTGYVLLAIVTKTANLLNIYGVTDPHLVSGSGMVISPGGRDSISHISFFIGEGSMTVPEPGTLALLGLGLIGIGIASRRRVA